MRRLFVVGVALFVVAGCVKQARLYSLDGSVMQAQFTYAGTGKGKVSLTHPDGEAFEGEYFTDAPSSVSAALLQTPWGPITTVEMTQMGRQVSYITAVGDRGTLMQCISFPRGSSGFGGCRDSKGREYRLHY